MFALRKLIPHGHQARTAGRRRVYRPMLESLEDRLAPSSDAVIQWNDVLLDAIRQDGTAPPLAARNMAIVHVAIYDAVNAIFQTHQPYAFTRGGPRDASPDAAVAGAAHRTLLELFPAQTATFDAALLASLAEIPDGPGESKGVALGRSVAQHILALRRHDGADRVVSYTTGTAPGDWQPTPSAFRQDPLLPQWPFVTPFTMSSGAQFRPAGPAALGSVAYTNAFDEVKAIGELTSLTRTPDQTQIAFFWADGPGTATPPGHWNEIAQDVSIQQGNTLAENARLFALLNLAVADAGIVSWDAKYEFNFWRPVTAIRAADSDGNPDTDADPDWTPLINTPPFPAYTSGHSTFSSAASAVLAALFGDRVSFTTGSEHPLAGPRSFTSFSAAAQEAGLSRIFGGIHWSFDNSDGLATGAALGQFVADRFLLPLSDAVAQGLSASGAKAAGSGGLELALLQLPPGKGEARDPAGPAAGKLGFSPPTNSLRGPSSGFAHATPGSGAKSTPQGSSGKEAGTPSIDALFATGDLADVLDGPASSSWLQ